MACPRGKSRSERQIFHFMLIIPPFNLPLIYLIIKQSTVWYRLQIDLRGS